MSSDLVQNHHRTAIALKGGMFTLTTIQILENNLEELALQLDEKIKQAPNFFHYAPIVLDVQKLRPQSAIIDFTTLIHLLKSKKLIPIGLRGATKTLKEAAIGAGLAIFPEDKVTHSKKSASNLTKSETITIEPMSVQVEPLTAAPTRIISQPIRSGQQIYAPGGDLIVLSSVSHGAELLADGHIHVYGSLRGRALAGVMGNTEAMIFCRSLEAELISIAGQYQVSEDLKETCWKQSACIQLQEGRLNIRSV